MKLRVIGSGLAVALLSAPLIYIFYQGNGIVLAASLFYGIGGALAIVLALTFRRNRAVVDLLAVTVGWIALAAKLSSEVELLAGDWQPILLDGVILVLWGGALASAAWWIKTKTGRTYRWYWWAAIYIAGAQAVVLTLPVYLAWRNVYFAMLAAVIVTLFLGAFVLDALEWQYGFSLTNWIGKHAYTRDRRGRRRLKPLARLALLIVALGYAGVGVLVLAAGPTEARVKAGMLLCPTALGLLAIALGAGPVADAIFRGIERAHGLGREDDPRRR